MKTTVVGSLLALLLGHGSLVLAWGPFGPPGGANRIQYFGGVQQQDYCGVPPENFFTPDNSVHNHVTGDYWCPPGVPLVPSGRVIGPESRCGVWQYQCAFSGPLTLSGLRVNFGGMYQKTDKVPPEISSKRFHIVPNPLTGGASCPERFTAVLVGGVLFPEVEIGANQYACISGDPTAIGAAYGGVYQWDDCWGGNDVVNGLTGDFTCPDGFTPYPSGRIKSPEGWQCGANQYVCMKW